MCGSKSFDEATIALTIETKNCSKETLNQGNRVNEETQIVCHGMKDDAFFDGKTRFNNRKLGDLKLSNLLLMKGDVEEVYDKGVFEQHIFKDISDYLGLSGNRPEHEKDPCVVTCQGYQRSLQKLWLNLCVGG